MNEDRAARYHRLKRRTGVASLVWTAAVLCAFLWTGLSVSLRTAAASAAAAAPPGWEAAAATTLYVAALLLVTEAAGLPLAFFGGYVLERRYGLSTLRAAGWLADQLKSFAVGLVLGAGAANVVYYFVRRDPAGWWLPAGLVFALFIVGLATLAPVLLLPLFYRLRPLSRETLRARLMALAARAGARVVGAYEWGLADKTRKANAALTGLGHTRRILVSDTMLADYSDDEIEVVLAHELGHHVHGDVWKGLLFESGLVMAGFYAAARLLARAVGPLGLDGPADPAGLPLLLLAGGAVSLVMMPAAHALSRAHERRADRFALELTRNPPAFVSAMKRLAAQNLAEERPTKITEWLFYSHPPIRERIAAAQAFRG